MRRWVGFIYMDGFHARVEQELGHPSPFAVVEGKVVRDACLAARRAGVEAGVAVSVARRLCSDLRTIPLDARRYRPASRRWMRRCLDIAPWLEPVGLEGAFLDLNGQPDVEGAMVSLVAALEGFGFSVRGGLAANKLVARAAARTPDPLGQAVTVVPHGAEAAFLAPLPVASLWPLDPRTLGRLQRLEYRNAAEVAAAPVADLKAHVGKTAAFVRSVARGVYPDPVRPDFPEAVIRLRARWLEGLERRNDVDFAVKTLAEAGSRQMGGRCCRVLSVTLEMEGGARIETRETRRVLDRVALVPSALRLAGQLSPTAPVVGVAVVAASFVDPAPLQADLFTLDKARRRQALQEAVLCLEERFGKRVLFPLSNIAVPWRERAWAAFWERHRGAY